MESKSQASHSRWVNFRKGEPSRANVNETRKGLTHQLRAERVTLECCLVRNERGNLVSPRDLAERASSQMDGIVLRLD